MSIQKSSSLLNRAGLWRGLYWSCAAAVLIVPAIAMRFTAEFRWTGEDFIFAAVLTGLTGLVLELALRTSSSLAYRIGAVLSLAAAFLLIWANGAVGIIGNEGNPANLMFAGVIAVAMAGVIVARFRPRDMARAMYVTAGAQLIVFLLALAFELGFIPFATLFWCALWTGSGALFARAARKDVSSS